MITASRAFLLAAASGLLSGLLLAAPPSHPQTLMLVVDKEAHRITIYDHATEQPLCSAEVGVNPHEAAFSNDGRLAFVPIYGTTAVGLAGTDEHALYILRTADCKQLGIIDTGLHRRLHGIYVGRDNLIYLTSEVSQSLLIIDPRQRKLVAAIPTGSPYSHMIAVLPDLSRAFVSNIQSKTISVLDLPHRKLLQQIPTESQNQRMVLSPDLHWFVTSLGPVGKVDFFRTRDTALDFQVAVDGHPFVTRFSPDGQFLYVAGSSAQGSTAWKISVPERKVIATLGNLGKAVGTLAIDPEGDRVFVSDQAKDWISEITTADWKLVKRIPTAKGPDEIVFGRR